MTIDYLIGAVFGVFCLIPFMQSPVRTLAQNGYVALAMMLMIYVGAHLAASDFTRIMQEMVFSSLVLWIAYYLRGAWPLGVAALITLHGAYDFVAGAESGVAPWYPSVCVGFDFIVGPGLAFLILQQRTK